MRHTIQIDKDGWVSLSTVDILSSGIGLGDIGVDVEIVDLREKKLPVGQQAWAVINKDGDIVDLYTTEVKREDLVLHDTEQIVEGMFTRSDTPLPSREAVEKAVEQSIIDDHVMLDRARILEIVSGEKKDIDVALNDPTADYIAEDSYDTKHEAFLYGYNQAVTDIIKIVKGK